MTVQQIAGAGLVALPFLGITAFMVRAGGWETAALAWGFTLGIIAILFVGLVLLVGVTA